MTSPARARSPMPSWRHGVPRDHPASPHFRYRSARPIRWLVPSVNVVGHAHVLEAARQVGIAATWSMPVRSHRCRRRTGRVPIRSIGVYKLANEGVAGIYWQDWQVSSIGVRPSITVYGPGRDQGLTSAPTRAMLAAALGQTFRIEYDTTMHDAACPRGGRCLHRL